MIFLLFLVASSFGANFSATDFVKCKRIGVDKWPDLGALKVVDNAGLFDQVVVVKQKQATGVVVEVASDSWAAALRLRNRLSFSIDGDSLVIAKKDSTIVAPLLGCACTSTADCGEVSACARVSAANKICTYESVRCITGSFDCAPTNDQTTVESQTTSTVAPIDTVSPASSLSKPWQTLFGLATSWLACSATAAMPKLYEDRFCSGIDVNCNVDTTAYVVIYMPDIEDKSSSSSTTITTTTTTKITTTPPTTTKTPTTPTPTPAPGCSVIGAVLEVPSGVILTQTMADTWIGKHVKVRGSVNVTSAVNVHSITLELIGPSARDSQLHIQNGGQLYVAGSTIGGTTSNGTAVQTGILIDEGGLLWLNTTCVQYSYGFSVFGTLDARNLVGGVNPDSVIVSTRGQVRLEDSVFDVSLTGSSEAGRFELDLPVNRSLSVVLGSRAAADTTMAVPGAQWRVELKRHTVPNYWFWFQNVDAAGIDTSTQIVFTTSTVLIPAVSFSGVRAHETPISIQTAGWRMYNDTHSGALVGDFACSTELLQSKFFEFRGLSLWANASVQVGGFGLYLSSGSSIVAKGPALFTEIILTDSSLWIEGTPNTFDTSVACAACDVKNSLFTIRNAVVGYRWEPKVVKGELVVREGGKVRVESSLYAHLRVVQKHSSGLAVFANSRRMTASPTGRTCPPSSLYGLNTPVAGTGFLVVGAAWFGVGPSASRTDGVSGGAQITNTRDTPFALRRVGRRLYAPGQTSGVVVVRSRTGDELARVTVTSSDSTDTTGLTYTTLPVPLTIMPSDTLFVIAETPSGEPIEDFRSIQSIVPELAVASAYVDGVGALVVGQASVTLAGVGVQVDVFN